MLSNSSYNITSLTVSSTVTNGTVVTTVVFIVDFVQNVSLTENATAVPEQLPNVIYTFGELVGVTPSGECAGLSLTPWMLYCSINFYSLQTIYMHIACYLWHTSLMLA